MQLLSSSPQCFHFLNTAFGLSAQGTTNFKSKYIDTKAAEFVTSASENHSENSSEEKVQYPTTMERLVLAGEFGTDHFGMQKDIGNRTSPGHNRTGFQLECLLY